jgi:hypothetical protein
MVQFPKVGATAIHMAEESFPLRSAEPTYQIENVDGRFYYALSDGEGTHPKVGPYLTREVANEAGKRALERRKLRGI